MSRSYLLAGAAALAVAAFISSAPTSASAADIIEEPQPENNWYVSIHGGWKFGEDWDDHASKHKHIERCVPNFVPVLGLLEADTDNDNDNDSGHDEDLGEPGDSCTPETRLESVAPGVVEEIDIDIDADLEVETDGGPRVGGSVGHYFGEIFAIEAEVAWMRQDLEEATLDNLDIVVEADRGESQSRSERHINCDSPHCTQELDGDVTIFTVMGNAILGLPLGGSVIQPYVGVGAGVAFVNFNDVELHNGAGGWGLDDSDTTFALQAFVGLNFALTQNVALGLRGRVLHIGDVEVKDDFGFEHELDSDLIPSVEGVLTVALP
jgi:opacity protein-like surface antigen